MMEMAHKNAAKHLLSYQHLYTSSPMSKFILKEFFDLPQDQVIPLSISHGIDFNHERFAQDVLNPEPIHWCYNKNIEQRARTVKKTVEIPHPWLLLHKVKGTPDVVKNGRILVIGPPPSASNDTNLFQSLANVGIRADAILVKSRDENKTQGSFDFWNDRGVKPVSAQGSDKLHYHRLMDLLLDYEYVVSPVLSSVTIFASALGCKITMLRDYQHCSYSPVLLDFKSISTARVVRDLISSFVSYGTSPIAIRHSRELLGAGFFCDSMIEKEQLERLFDEIEQPIYVPAAGANRSYAYALGAIARISGRTSFLKYGLADGLRKKLFGTHTDIVCKRINLIDAAMNGLTDKNFSVRSLNPEERNVRSGHGADW